MIPPVFLFPWLLGLFNNLSSHATPSAHHPLWVFLPAAHIYSRRVNRLCGTFADYHKVLKPGFLILQRDIGDHRAGPQGSSVKVRVFHKAENFSY
jgi:hypothetical protein